MLREVLQTMVDNNEQVSLNDGKAKWDAATLLSTLSEGRLMTKVHKTPMYIAMVDEGGYMGEVLYRLSPKAN